MQKRRSFRSPKQSEEFEGNEKHIWHKKLNKLTELRFKEIEDLYIDEEDPSIGRRKHDQS